ncbi:MAG: flagellar hook capping FlgD N-terminal domain-containing protein [Limnohabitans sp.]|jgi:flagellar hook assembly protein FlgD|nr:flagellar hook capping FlgD N-terminal domain-containing protein [Limnohabitans sp.]
MSAINALTGGATATAGSNRFTDLSSEEFIKIIFTELQNQDPFKPNDSGALLEQLDSIRSIESDIQLGDQLRDIVFQNQLAGAGNLIGKRVAGLTADSERVGGVVKSVARNGEEIALVLDNGWVLPIQNVEYIDQQPAPNTPSGGTGSTGSTGGQNPPSAPVAQPNQVISGWGASGSGTNNADLNGDGKIDATDLALSLGS